jgi:hypothetical protein
MPKTNKVSSYEREEIRRQYQREYKAKNREKLRKYNREWQQAWRKKNNYKDVTDYAIKFPKKVLAHKLLQRAIKLGKIVSEPCKVCGNPATEGHHPDYHKPLEVFWLCSLHHKQLHLFTAQRIKDLLGLEGINELIHRSKTIN